MLQSSVREDVKSDVAKLFVDNHRRINAQLVDDYLEYISDNLQFSKETIRSRKYVLGRYLALIGDRNLQELSIQEVDGFFLIRARSVKASSLNIDKAIMRDFFRYVDRYREIRLRFDTAMIRNSKEDDPDTNFLTPDDINRLISKFDNKQDRLILATFFYSGLRIGELVKLAVEDIHDTEIVVKGKGGKRRVVPIPPELAEALRNYIYDEGIRGGVIFRHQLRKSNLRNIGFTASGLRKRLQYRLAAHNIHFIPHSARHGIATELLKNGMDIRALQEFLGHARIETTQRYTHVTNSHLRAAYQRSLPETRITL